MSAIKSNPSGIQPKEKGRAPGGCGQKENHMERVMEARAEINAGSGNITPFNVQSEFKKAAIQIDKLVEESKTRGKPVTRMLSLTPLLASVLLERNPANRRIIDGVVEAYAHDIARGAWTFNGQTVIVSDTGELNDGQHRCSAVVKSGKPIDIILVVGIERATRTTLDQGRSRSAADYLSMEGNVNANVLAAAANFVWQWRNRGMLTNSGRLKATKSEVLETVRDNPGLAKSVAFVHVTAARAAGGPSILAFAHFALKSTQHPEDADYFIHSLMNGAGLKEGSPILYARNRLINKIGRLRPNEKAEIIFRAWNAWRTGSQLSRIVLTGGILPVLEP